MNEIYATPMISDREIDKAALLLLAGFDQQPVAQIRAILKAADFWLDATATLECGPSSELQKALAAWTEEAERREELKNLKKEIFHSSSGAV